MRVHGVGRGRRQVQLPHLLAHIPRDERNGRLHFRNHAFRFFDALHAALTEPFVLGNGADGVDVLLEVPGKEFAVAAYAADVRARRFPGREHVYGMDAAELEKLVKQIKSVSAD